jgi:hypothetical protein
MRDEAFAPLADGVSVAVQLLGDPLVGGVRVGRGEENEATAKGQGLGRGASADEGLKLIAQVRGQDDPRGERPRHDVPPCTRGNDETEGGVIMVRFGTFVQTLAANL